MRKILTICYALIITSFVLPALLGRPAAGTPPGTGPAVPALSPTASDEGGRIKLLCAGELLELPLEEYLVGVVAAEMPASFPQEALRSQAVAARSYTLYRAAAKRHGEAQVCTASGCCQAWMDESAMRSRWGADYGKYRARIESAVRSTAGEYLSYGGEAVCAAFHSSSAGMTEASGSIWSPTPYLVSVASPETAENVPGLVTRAWISPGDFSAALREKYPTARFSGPADTWLGPVEHSEGGRVESLLIGGVSVPGAALRQLFSLRSTAFELCWDGAGFLFTVYGYGHGVGMSQYGAKLMAEDGADYTRILAHYYPGTTLTR